MKDPAMTPPIPEPPPLNQPGLGGLPPAGGRGATYDRLGDEEYGRLPADGGLVEWPRPLTDGTLG